ncbi:MAG: shikimate dehydrogenase [Thermodesulfovibrionales bacterium]|nr:shikimate dehydrogenase [Thermodesulfovibrionales bacterium]
MKINGKTKITGIFGYPIEHTLSPAMHNAAFQVLGLDYCYVPFLVHPDFLGQAVQSVRALNLAGVNVTVPHKEKIIPLLDHMNEEALFIGAVNTVVNNEGRLTGYNTDGRGFMESLAEKGISSEGKDILIIGAGGSARAVGYYLCQKANSLFIQGRTREKAKRFVQDLCRIKNNSYHIEDLSDLGRFQIIINATPLGLREEDPLPINTGALREGQIVYDLSYKETMLQKEASKLQCIVLNGLGMLLWQGALAFELWTGRKPDREIMRRALNEALSEPQGIFT